MASAWLSWRFQSPGPSLALPLPTLLFWFPVLRVGHGARSPREAQPLQHPETPVVHHLSPSNPMTALPPPSPGKGFVSLYSRPAGKGTERAQEGLGPQRRMLARPGQGAESLPGLEGCERRNQRARGEGSELRSSIEARKAGLHPRLWAPNAKGGDFAWILQLCGCSQDLAAGQGGDPGADGGVGMRE